MHSGTRKPCEIGDIYVMTTLAGEHEQYMSTVAFYIKAFPQPLQSNKEIKYDSKSTWSMAYPLDRINNVQLLQ